MDFQQSQGYMRPLPPPPPPPASMAADPYHQYHQSQRLPVPQPNPWYSSQFQFQHSTSPPALPPPPPHAPPLHQQWAQQPPPPPLADHLVAPYPTPPPYSAPHPLPHSQYPHPHAALPPRPHPPPPQIPQSYPHVNQEWGTPNWGHHQSWEYQANTNEEVWAAKARAWAAAKAASDNLQPQLLPYGYKDENLAGDSTAVYSGRDSSISPSVHQQEVPSSYSSIAGDSIRGIDIVATVPSDYNFVPPADPAVHYPSVPSVLPSVPQIDPSVQVPPPVSGHSAPMFGRLPGPSFQPTVSSVTAPFGVGAGPDMHTGTAFPGDAFGASMISERPKKASVPNWLREEIIKKKPTIVSSGAELPKEDSQSVEDEGVDGSYGNGDRGDSKTDDSPRSAEVDDDDEDEMEAARTAAINLEIKRVLTEVLLKVTDELFDEIATKVLSEDDPTVEVDHGVSDLDHKAQTTTLAVATSKAASKVLVPVKTKDTNSYGASEKSDSGTPGDVLGLSSYASDDDNNEIESSGKQNVKDNYIQQQSTLSKLSKGTALVDNGGSAEETKEHDNPESDLGSNSQNATRGSDRVAVLELKDEREANTSNVDSGVAEHEMLDGIVSSNLKKTLPAQVAIKSEKIVEYHRSTGSLGRGQEVGDKSDKTDRRDHERNTSGRNHNAKEVEIDKENAHEKEGKHSRHDERSINKERMDDRNGSKERVKEKGSKSAEKAKDSDSRKRSSPYYDKEGKKERHAERRASFEEENDKKKERTKDGKRAKDTDSRKRPSPDYDKEGKRERHAGREKERAKDDKREKPRDRNSSESSRHKRRSSSSAASRGRDNKDGLVVGHTSDSSDESSDNSKKKLRSKRHKSPSPVRSRKRQVSRSPHSKHSQRRHSPYSSLETSRGRRSRSRSRSRSPMRRRR